jgi:predicted Rdx family selenoprotein
VRVAQELMTGHQHSFESLTFLPGSKGIFDVAADGALVWSKADHGRQANPGEVLDALDAHLA